MGWGGGSWDWLLEAGDCLKQMLLKGGLTVCRNILHNYNA